MEDVGSIEEEILCVDTSGSILFRSRAFLKIIGSNTAPGPQLIPFYYLEDRESFRLALQHSARTCNTIQFSCTLVDGIGMKIDRQVSLNPSPIETNIICCIFKSTSTEKTTCISSTSAVKDSPNKRFRSTLESIVVGESSPVIPQRWDQLLSTQLTLLNRFFEQAPFPIGLVEVIDNGFDCRYVFANEACSRRYGLSPDRVRSMRASLLLSREELHEWLALFRTIERDTDFKVVYAGTRQTPSGWFETYCSHVRDGYYLFMRKDVTVAKNLEMDLREQSKKLEEAVQAKNRFLAIMSHEIRTPLAGVIGSMCLLAEAKLGIEHAELVRISQLCGEQALALVDDILDVAKIDDTHGSDMAICRTAFSFHDLLEDALDVAAIPADEKALELICDITADAPDRVYGDSVRLRQVLTNLLANAVKFTTAGSVTLTARSATHLPEPATPEPLSSQLVEVAVRDTGIGISPRTQTRLFQPFTQGDDSTSRRYGGSGLGLYIAKRLVSLMGGDLKCYSQGDGCGSTFSFVLPMEIDTRHGLEPSWLTIPANSNRRSRTVVIVSLSQQFARVYADVVWRLGYSVSVHVRVEEALETARAACEKHTQEQQQQQQQQPPQNGEEQLPLVTFLIDAGTYDQSLEKFEAIPRTAVLLLCGSGTALDNQHALTLRARKPLRRKTLAQLLEQQFLSSRRMSVMMQDPQDGSSSVFRSNAALRILVAEDNAMNQAIIRKLLHSLGLDNSLIVPDGAQAVAAAQRENFDIVLMDIMMPIMGGVEATERIRALPTGKQPRIIALTANAFPEEHRRFLRAGMDFVLTKPLRKRELAEVFVRFGSCAVG